MRRGEEAKAAVVAALGQVAEQRGPAVETADVSAYLAEYYRESATADLVDVDPLDLYGAALAHRELAERRTPGRAIVRVVAPRFDRDGWTSKHAVVQTVTDDMPFVVDSIRMAINARDLGIHVIHHPVIGDESLVHVEVDRRATAIADELVRDLERSLADVRAAVDDWSEMVQDMERTIERLRTEADGHVPDDELAEAVEFLRWLVDDHFTFLGVRSYSLVAEGDVAVVSRQVGTGLGILRGDGSAVSEDDPLITELTPEATRLALAPAPMTLTKANARSTVHRPTRLDYVGVKRFDEDGRVVGERRYLGLYASRMYTGSALAVPLVRRKIEIVREMAGFPPASHSDKDLLAILETYPRDELVQVRPRRLYETAIAIHQLQDRRRTRVFLRPDDFHRFWSAMVYLPRDRYNTTTRLAVERILLDVLGGTDATYQARVSESALARLHFVVHCGSARPDVDIAALEDRVAAAVRDWGDELREQLVDELGEDRGLHLAMRYADAFGAGYRSDHPPRAAVADIERLEALDEGDIDFQLQRRLESPHDEVRLRVFRSGTPVLVSDLVPVLEHLGARVTEQRPYEVAVQDEELHVYDIGMRISAEVDVVVDDRRVVDALHAVWDGRTESDTFHQLILSADLDWREAAGIRAYSRYMRQIGVPFSAEYVERCITAHPAVAGAIIELFHARFRAPVHPESAEELRLHVVALLDRVASLDEDRVLRMLLGLVLATLRTNAYQRDEAGRPKTHLALKIDSAAVPDLPLPRPHREIYVYSPDMEGVHLRGSLVARGGLRWSDRREDYRTEVLGLMKAQMVKNAVIVPSGAKGGFVVKEPPSDPDERRAAGVVAYKTFISGLLDVTDNLVDDEIVPPPEVVRHDGDDPYLVVAADKGTATFSDIANQLAERRGFWLGDAFASGGSAGYDHKAMGITARGAWESVKRHFRELETDVQREPITVVGIGDMAGDVFGNGMLLSTHLRLVGAFNHLHVFVDPTPDPTASFAERQRLFDLPRSSWDDYDRSLISPGGGVFSRSAKAVTLSPQMRELLGVEDDSLTPNQLIHTLLQTPVDLLWNGGIGTYVKARWESHADVGDKANDPVRVDADQLRCRVIAEGGNLGLTHAGRVAFAKTGGRVNTDAIDNSAGVDCSDHEVNIKIAVDAAVRSDDLTTKQRDALLESMTDEVAELVLADNVRQNQALVNAVVQAHSLLGVHQRYLKHLESDGSIDRAVEGLPDDEELAERRADGGGLTAPEFAVLLAYTKNLLVDDLLAADLPDDPWCETVLLDYFPQPLRERFPDQLRGHRLRREIVATALANEVVDHQGITSIYRIGDETGADKADIVRASVAATRIFQLHSFREAVAELDHHVSATIQTRMLLDARRLAERGARWLLRTRVSGSLGEVVERFGPGVARLGEELPQLLVGGERTYFDSVVSDLVADGVPEATARRVGTFDEVLGGLDCVDLASECGEQIDGVTSVRLQVEEVLGLRWLIDQVTGLPRDNRWQSLARGSLRQDLHDQVTRLTGSVLASTSRDVTAEARVARWTRANEPGVARLAHVLADIRATGSGDLATLSVGFREVTQLG